MRHRLGLHFDAGDACNERWRQLQLRERRVRRRVLWREFVPGRRSCVLWCRRDQFSSHAACCEATRLQSYPKTRVPFFFLRASSAASRPGMYSPPIATLRPQYTVGLVPRASAAVLHESRRRTFHTLRSGRWHDNSIITKTDVLKLVFLHEVSSGQAYHAIVKCSPHDALLATRTCSCDT